MTVPSIPNEESVNKVLPGVAVAPVAPTSRAAMFSPEAFQAAVWSSYDLTTTEGKARLVNAMQSPDTERLSDLNGQVLDIVHLTAHTVTMMDEETGEEFEADRIIVEDAKGTQYAAVSTGVRRSMQILSAVYGSPPWTPALKVRVEMKRTRKNRMVTLLTPVL